MEEKFLGGKNTKNCDKQNSVCKNSSNNIGINDTTDEKIKRNNRISLIFVGLSLLCIIFYVILGAKTDALHVSTVVIMLFIWILMQICMHIFFTNTVKNESFSWVKGYDSGIEYNILEVKRYITKVNMNAGVVSTVHIFILGIANLFKFLPKVIDGTVLLIYFFNYTLCFLMDEYCTVDKIFINEMDKRRDKKCIKMTFFYLVSIVIGIGAIIYLFETRKININTTPAIKLAFMCIVGLIITTMGFAKESVKLKKTIQQADDFMIGKGFIICNVVSIILYVCMFFV